MGSASRYQYLNANQSFLILFMYYFRVLIYPYWAAVSPFLRHCPPCYYLFCAQKRYIRSILLSRWLSGPVHISAQQIPLLSFLSTHISSFSLQPESNSSYRTTLHRHNMQRTPGLLFEITGKITVEDVAARSGSGWRNGINTAVPGLRARVSCISQGSNRTPTMQLANFILVPSREDCLVQVLLSFDLLRIQFRLTMNRSGSQAHLSRKDPSDTKPCVTLAMYSASGTRFASAHIHEDGTFNDFQSRAGKSGVQDGGTATTSSNSDSKSN